MLYPTIGQYLESVSHPAMLLRHLRKTRLCSDTGVALDELPFRSGRNGVVFPMESAQGKLALKCFTGYHPGREEAYSRICNFLGRTSGSPYLVRTQWLPDEVTVFDPSGAPALYPALSMEWVEGVPLSAWLEKLFRERPYDIREQLEELSLRFDRMGSWLLEQSFAHGDLKPENIMIRPDGELALIDYDGFWLPEMAAEEAREAGTPGYCHPRRREGGFGKHIDDYSLALLSLSFRMLAQSPEWYARYHRPGLLIFSPEAILHDSDLAFNALKRGSLADDPLTDLLSGMEDRALPGLAEALTRHNGQSRSFDPEYKADAKEGIILCRWNGKYGYLRESDGLPLTRFVYDDARDFSEGRAAVCRAGKWAYLGADGVRITEWDYEECDSFSGGLAPVCIGGRWSYVDSEFRMVSRIRFDDAWPLCEGLGLVRRKEKYGFIGPDGRMAIPARYDFAQPFSEGAACVAIDGVYGYIDRRGRWLIRPMFDYARPKHNGKAYVEYEGKGREIGL